MNGLWFVYDDTVVTSPAIQNIVAKNSFGDIILRRRRVRDICLFCVGDCAEPFSIRRLSSSFPISAWRGEIENKGLQGRFFHFFSNFVIVDAARFILLLKKLRFMRDEYVLCVGEAIAGVIFQDSARYVQFLRAYETDGTEALYADASSRMHLTAEFAMDISDRTRFLQYISGGFDARFFNSFSGDAYVVTKRSPEIQKLRREYTFFQLLPDTMKMWFIRPFDYREEAGEASYSMERYNMTDLAIRWIHEAISPKEFRAVMDKVFYFISSRAKKPVCAEAYRNEAKRLYVDKVWKRRDELKASAYYPLFNAYIRDGTAYDDCDAVLQAYMDLLAQCEKRTQDAPAAVIGHGDLCFSNILYNREVDLLRLIDPRGAAEEAELWTNPYYDVAKLSHSVCGRYDFFNAGLYEIALGTDFRFSLRWPFDPAAYIVIFQEYLAAAGFDYVKVRLYEASLFLSMLPLHIDYPHKVFAFLLNAIEILQEVRTCLEK